MIRTSTNPLNTLHNTSRFLRFFASVGLYLALSLALSSMLPKPPISPNDLINPLSQYAQRTAQNLAPASRNPALVTNFLANERNMGPQMNNSFKSSGTAHLLAISGGQVSFLAPVIALVLVKPIILSLLRALPPLQLLVLSNALRDVVEIASAAVCAAAFGATGSLLRTGAQKIARATPLISRVAHKIFPWGVLISHASITKIAVLALLVPFLGNPLQDLSFLFSSLGAGVLTLSSQNLHTFSKKYPLALSGAVHTLTTTLVTSGTIAALLIPISNSNPANAIMANLVSIPLVTFWICPASLAILMIPVPCAQEFLLPILDTGLDFFAACARAFSQNTTPAHLPFFTAKHYLLFCLAIVWSADDLRFEKRPLAVSP